MLEKRFLSLEVAVINRLSALEADVRTLSQDSVTDRRARLVGRNLHTLDNLDSRVSHLEAQTLIATETLEDTRLCGSDSKRALDTAMRIVEESISKVSSFFAELQNDSRAPSELHTTVPAGGNVSTLSGMQLAQFELSHNLGKLRHSMKDAEQHHNTNQISTLASLAHYTRHDMPKLYEDLDPETESTVTEPPDVMMTR